MRQTDTTQLSLEANNSRAARSGAPSAAATPLRVLGIDPSTVGTGRALLVADGGRETVTDVGVYAPRGEDLNARLLSAYEWLQQILAAQAPDVVALETPFFKLNAQTLITLASLGAAYRLAAVRAGLRVLEIQPARRCTAIGLAGNASKSQVLYTVNAIYNLALTDHNMADAVAIAAAGALALRIKSFEEG